MERRKALAVAGAGAMLSASAAVVIASGLWRGSEPDVGAAPPSTTTTVAPLASTPAEPVVITEVRDVYDTVVVPTAANAPAAPATAGAPSLPAPTDTATGSSPGSSPSTVVPPTTTTTLHVELPENWPPDRPIPPMPEGCQEPHLEDNGVWNCG